VYSGDVEVTRVYDHVLTDLGDVGVLVSRTPVMMGEQCQVVLIRSDRFNRGFYIKKPENEQLSSSVFIAITVCNREEQNYSLSSGNLGSSNQPFVDSGQNDTKDEIANAFYLFESLRLTD